jgi:hypothetical protein
MDCLLSDYRAALRQLRDDATLALDGGVSREKALARLEAHMVSLRAGLAQHGERPVIKVPVPLPQHAAAMAVSVAVPKPPAIQAAYPDAVFVCAMSADDKMVYSWLDLASLVRGDPYPLMDTFEGDEEILKEGWDHYCPNVDWRRIVYLANNVESDCAKLVKLVDAFPRWTFAAYASDTSSESSE